MKYFDKIERYLNGEMTSEEAESFNKEVLKNEELAKELEMQRMEESILNFAVEEQLLEQIEAIKKEKKSSEKIKSRTIGLGKTKLKKALAIAAGISFIAIVYFLLQESIFTPSFTALAQEIYKEYPPNLSGTKTIDNESKDFTLSKLLLMSDSTQDLETATTYFDLQKSSRIEAYYFAGHGYWKLKEYHKSLENFEYFLRNSEADHQFSPHAEFYKSIVLVALERIDEARQFIHEKKIGHPLEKQFDALLNRI